MSERIRATLLLLVGATALALIYNACSNPIDFSNGASNADPLSCEEDSTRQCYEVYSVHDQISVTKLESRSDILIIFDNSGSMSEENKHLAERLDGFVNVLEQHQIDWQLCYTSSDMSTSGDRGRIREWKTVDTNNKVAGAGTAVITSQTPDREKIFATTASSIGDDGNMSEMGLTALTAASELSTNQACFRDNAAFSAIIISDEDHKSCGGRCQTHPASVNHPASSYTRQYRAMTVQDRPDYVLDRLSRIWPGKPASVHSIVIQEGNQACYDAQDKTHPAFFGLVYSHLSKLSGGIVGNICAPDYTSQLESIGSQIHKTLDSINLKCAPIERPKIIDVATATAIDQFTWEGNKVYFVPPLAEGTQIDVEYLCRRPINKFAASRFAGEIDEQAKD